jgi:hypothetical protein
MKSWETNYPTRRQRLLNDIGMARKLKGNFRKRFEYGLIFDIVRPHHKYLVRGNEMFFLEWDGLTAIFYHYSGSQIIYFRDSDLKAKDIVKTNGLCASVMSSV